MNKKEIKNLKRLAKKENLLIETDLLNKRKIERKCFWTWPWGHVWKKGGCYPGGEDDYCSVCGKMSPSDMA